MTNKEARDLLAKIKIREPNELIVYSWWDSFVKDYQEALDMAMEALEQRKKTDVLDKIRAEIEIKHDRAKALNMVLQMNTYTDCLQVIDKYREVTK